MWETGIKLNGVQKRLNIWQRSHMKEKETLDQDQGWQTARAAAGNILHRLNERGSNERELVTASEPLSGLWIHLLRLCVYV